MTSNDERFFSLHEAEISFQAHAHMPITSEEVIFNWFVEHYLEADDLYNRHYAIAYAFIALGFAGTSGVYLGDVFQNLFLESTANGLGGPKNPKAKLPVECAEKHKKMRESGHISQAERFSGKNISAILQRRDDVEIDDLCVYYQRSTERVLEFCQILRDIYHNPRINVAVTECERELHKFKHPPFDYRLAGLVNSLIDLIRDEFEF